MTGAAGGIGRECARVLAEAGAQLLLSDLDGAGLADTAEELRQVGNRVDELPADLSLPKAAIQMVEDAGNTAGRLDGLLACAGVMRTQPMLELTESEWRRIMSVNLDSTFFVLQAAGKRMLAQGSGSIVLLSSISGRSGRADAAHYAASKAAVLSMTKSAALALAPSVRVNSICPGVALTRMWEGIISDRDDRFGAGAGTAYLQALIDRTPLKRVGTAREVALVGTFLLSDLASFITGQAINVDGGLEMD